MEELKAVIGQAATGDPDAFKTIVRCFQDMAVGYAFSILGDFHLAEDAAQEAFIEAHRDLPQLRERTAFPGWFRKLVFKHCDRLTRGKQLSLLPLEAAVQVVSAEPNPFEALEVSEMNRLVRENIQGLPEHERNVTTLFYISDYSQREIAAFLEVPVTTVQKRLHDARKRLKKRMITMVQENLQENRPSRDDEFTQEVLFKAIEAADVKKVGDLLSKHPSLVQIENEIGQTPLESLTRVHGHKWRDKGRRRIYDLLISKGAVPDIAAAIVADDRQKVRELIEADPDLVHKSLTSIPNPYPDPEGRSSPLALAALYGRREIVEILLEAGADIDDRNSQALMSAAWSNKVELVNLLTSRGAKVAVEPHFLITACDDICPFAVDFLLDHGIDPNARAEGKPDTPLMATLRSYDKWDGEWKHQIIESLIAAGAEHNDDAILAIHRGRLDLLNHHLDAHPELIHRRFEIHDYEGYTPINGGTLLHIVAEYCEYPNALEFTKLLLEKGADVNAKANQNEQGIGGHTPIFHASVHWNGVSMIELLVEQGADLTVKGTFLMDGEIVQATPLSYALRRDSELGFSKSHRQNLVGVLRKYGTPE